MFKKALLALAMTAVAITGAAATDYGYVAEGVDFHSGPSPKFYQFGDFKECLEVQIDESSPGDGPKWYRISWADHYGWVRADDVSYDRNYCDEYEEEKPATY